MNHEHSPQTVAYLVKMFPRFSETFILAEILELERQGMDLRIVSLKPPADSHVHADVARVRAPVTYLPPVSRRAMPAYARAHAALLAKHPARYARTLWMTTRRRSRGATRRFVQAGLVAAQLEREGIGHVHAHFASSATSVAHFVEALTGIGYSFTAHAKDIYIDGVNPEVLRRKMDRARFVVTVSDFNAGHLAAIAPHATIHRIYNGLDLRQFHRNGTRPDELPLVLAVGRLVEKKGFDDLIAAAAILHARGLRFRTWIVGTGDREAALRQQIADLGLVGIVELPGPMPREELIGLYPRASVVVAPCVIGADGNRDGLPTVLIEAMALGVPVISTDVTGIPELVRDGETGRIVPQRDPAALAEAIADTLANPRQANALAERSRALVEREFDLRRNVTALRQRFLGAEARA